MTGGAVEGGSPADASPLQGITVVDTTRMLPGAVLARCLIDLGARLIKVEDPRGGDPIRHAPQVRGGMGLGFAVHYRGAESITLNLRDAAGATALRRIVGAADVLVESFRPGTLAKWGLAPDDLMAHNKALVGCSLPGYPPDAESETSTGHDLNFVAGTGALERMRVEAVPGLHIADVTSGLLAAGAITAALLARERNGLGRWIVQPLAAGPLPFLWWAWADHAHAGAIGTTDTLIGGRCPSYHTYHCSDGRMLAVGCLEPKFWIAFCQAVGRPELAATGLDTGERGAQAASEMDGHLRSNSLEHWMERVRGLDLPVCAVNDLEQARRDPAYRGLLEQLPLQDGDTLEIPGPAMPAVGRTPTRPAPRTGQDTDKVLKEFGFRAQEIEALRPKRR